MKRLATFITLILVLTLTNPPQGQAETFNTKKTMFRNAGGKWRMAFINIEPNKIEVHRVGTKLKKKEVVASFESAQIESEIKGFRRTSAAAALVGAGIGTVVPLMFLKEETRNSTLIPASAGYGQPIVLTASKSERMLSAKEAGIVIAATSGLAVAIGVSKAKRPYAKVTNGIQSIELRVHKRNTSRFISALEDFKANNPKQLVQ